MSQQNVQVLKNLYKSFMEGNLAAGLKCYVQGAEWDYPAIESVPYSGPRRGRDQIR